MISGTSGDECGNLLGKNTIDPDGRGIEKPRKATLTLTFFLTFSIHIYIYIYPWIVLILQTTA
jgi:hypothetical protein